MKYLIDTCVISEIVKPFPEKVGMDWLNTVPSERLFLSVVTIGEIRKGISRLANSKRKTELAEWLNTLLDDYKDRILSIDLNVAETWGEMQAVAENKGFPTSTIDGLIAAIARVNGLILVTRNESDFEECGISIFNPWASEG